MEIKMDFTPTNLILGLALGLVFFLFGMTLLSDNLEKMAGGKLESLLKKSTSNLFFGMLLGAGITIAIQSSSATTVMLVGLVSSGIMSFKQTLSVIFGANIGTTLTAWITGLATTSGGGVIMDIMKPANFSPVLALLGIALVMMAKSAKKKSVGTLLIGFAILMFGMELMKISVEPLSEIPAFQSLLLKFKNPIIGVLVGTIFTALIQSSAASVGVLQALAAAGGVTYGMAFPIIMGQNIGTCITSVISSFGTKANAKRVAVLHVAVNTIGTVIFLAVYMVLDAISLLPSVFSNDIDGPGIALIHTIFNLSMTAILCPFSKWIILMAEKIIKDDKEEDKPRNKFALDERLLLSPSVAINECNTYTLEMADKAYNCLKGAIDILENYDEKQMLEIKNTEKDIDMLEDALGSYLVKISASALSVQDSRKVSKMLHTIGDFERLGDHSVNMMKAAKEMHDKGISFSDEAKAELKVLIGAVREILDITFDSFRKNDALAASKVEPLEQVIDRLKAQIKSNHIERLQRGNCTITLGFILSDLLTDFERISDHCSNIAVAVIELIHGRFDPHEYLNAVKKGSEEFFEEFDEYSEKYVLPPANV